MADRVTMLLSPKKATPIPYKLQPSKTKFSNQNDSKIYEIFTESRHRNNNRDRNNQYFTGTYKMEYTKFGRPSNVPLPHPAAAMIEF
jgi:hypothetical protein